MRPSEVGSGLRLGAVIGRAWLALGALVVVAVGVVAFVSTGRAPSGTAAQRLQSWVESTTLGQDIGTLEGDGGHVREALAEHKGMGAVHTICAAMANDAQTFNDNLPSPDSVVTQLLARAYGLEYDAAESCYRAASPASGLMGRAEHDITTASRVFAQVLRRLRAKTGRSVPTTTTTVPNVTATFL